MAWGSRARTDTTRNQHSKAPDQRRPNVSATELPLPRPLISRFLRSCICILFLLLVILAGICVMITVLVIHPHKPRYRLLDMQITQINIARGPDQSLTDNPDPFDSTLNADVIVTVESYNRNHHLHVYNTRLVVILYYDGLEIGRTFLTPFKQKPKNTTVTQGIVSVRNYPLRHSVADSLNVSLARHAVPLQSKLAARVKFKYGIWTSGWHRWFNLKCDVVVSRFNDPAVGSHILFKNC